MKGKLVRSILFPKPSHFKFYSDSMKFIGVLAILAVVGYAVVLPFQIRYGFETKWLVDRSLNIITIAVPPSLPAVMTVGSIFAIRRLRRD